MKRAAALTALLLLTGCSSDPEPRAAAPAAVTPTAAASAVTAPSGLLVAVVRHSGGLELHRLDRSTRAATRERVLAPPTAGAEALDVALSSTQVCATWHVGEGEPFDDPRMSLVCYPSGSSTGSVVEGTTRPFDLALSEDGTRLAWAQYDQGENQVLNTARLIDGVLSAPRRFLARADQPETGERAFTGTAVQDLAWVEDGVLAVSTGVESDDGPDLLRLDVASPRTRGWLDDGQAVPVSTAGYLTYDSVVSVDGGTALAVERGSYLDEQRPPSRAVRVDLATGRVLEVLATAAEGRDMRGVSGSRDAVVYVTAELDEPLKPYLRLAGERRGTPITGLPADAEQVLTQG